MPTGHDSARHAMRERQAYYNQRLSYEGAIKMRITKKLYSELYDYFWNRADLNECSKLKALFYKQTKKGKYLNRSEIFKELYK